MSELDELRAKLSQYEKQFGQLDNKPQPTKVIKPTGQSRFGTSTRDSSGRIEPGEKGLRDGNAAAEERSRRDAVARRLFPTPKDGWDRKFAPVSSTPKVRDIGPALASSREESDYYRPNSMKSVKDLMREASGAFAPQALTLQAGVTPSASSVEPAPVSKRSSTAWLTEARNAFKTPTGYVTPVDGTSSDGRPRTAAFQPSGQQALNDKFGDDFVPRAGETLVQLVARRRAILQGAPAASGNVGTVTHRPAVRDAGGGVKAVATNSGTFLRFPNPYSQSSQGVKQAVIPEQYRVPGASPVATTRFSTPANNVASAKSEAASTARAVQAAMPTPTFGGTSTAVAKAIGTPAPTGAWSSRSDVKPPEKKVPWYLQPQEAPKATVGSPTGTSPATSVSSGIVATSPITSGAATTPGVKMPQEKPWQPQFSIDSTVRASSGGPSLTYNPDADESLRRKPGGFAAL